jgi:hypothetical protein
MRKPRLTTKVLRGLSEAMSEMCAGDLRDMQESGIIEDASDVERANEWLRQMIAYRRAKTEGE